MDNPVTTALAVRQGHIASLQTGLDFINTLDLWPAPRDHLDSAIRALAWLCTHDLMHREAEGRLVKDCEQSRAKGHQLLGRLHRTRGAMRGLLESAVTRGVPDPVHLTEINRALRTHYVYELVSAPEGVSLDHRHQGDPVDGALARLAESLARELVDGDRERLRVCQNEQCRWVFKDTSRAGRRKWCSMRTCGNRAKVARYRAQRKSDEPKGQR